MYLFSGEINHDEEALELTGTEEAPRVYAVLTRLSPEAAYREGMYRFEADIGANKTGINLVFCTRYVYYSAN